MISLFRKYPESIVAGAILCFVAYVFVDGIENVFRYKLFPYFCASVIVVLMIVEWTRIFSTRRGDGSALEPTPDSHEIAIDNDKSDEFDGDYKQRVLRLLLWIAALFLGIWLVGFVYTMPPFLILFLRFEAKLKWWLVLLITAISLALIQFLFVNFLGLQLPSSLLLS